MGLYFLEVGPHGRVGLHVSHQYFRLLNELRLLAGELTHIGIAGAEQVCASGQVFHETLVDLFGCDGDGLVFLGFQIGRPGIQGADVVRL